MRAYMENANDADRKKFQRWFLFLSGLLFWCLMGATLATREAHRHYALLGVFLPFIFLMVIAMTPLRVRLYLVFGTSALLKFAVAINAFNFALGLKLLIGRFEHQAEVIAILLGVMIGSTILLRIFVVPLWFYLVWLFCFPGFGSYHDPQADQGHKVREDYK